MIYEIYAILYLYKRNIGDVMKSDIEIAQSVTLKPITEIVEKVGISFDDIELTENTRQNCLSIKSMQSRKMRLES